MNIMDGINIVGFIAAQCDA